jgi:hypothetical protein
LQKSFLVALLSTAKIAGEKQRAAKLKAIQQAEYMKKIWPKLQIYAKGEVRTGLDCVELPIQDSDGEISVAGTQLLPLQNCSILLLLSTLSTSHRQKTHHL